MNFTSHEILKLIVKGTFEISLYWLTLDKNKWLSQKKKKKTTKKNDQNAPMTVTFGSRH